ncbi:TF211 protein, partial [Machaerirhynchus nigripectus]|nr:TF211 protein [Machaerirhynchus nigripectus]
LHASTHWGMQALCDHFLRTYVCIGTFEIARTVTRDCMTCQRINRKVMRKTSPGGRELARRPFQNIQIDFTELPQVQKFKYLLVIVDHLTHWVEAFPTIRATADVVSKILLEQIIPRCGVVNTIDSDRGPHFTAQILQQTMTALDIKWKLHTPWRPQSSGKVERMNQTLKMVLTKLVVETKMNWLKCLPLALMRIRTRPRTDMGVSPYEAMFGLPFLTTPNCMGTYEEGQNDTKRYIQTIANTLEELRKRGYLPQTSPKDFKIHSFQPGDWVLMKVWKDI